MAINNNQNIALLDTYHPHTLTGLAGAADAPARRSSSLKEVLPKSTFESPVGAGVQVAVDVDESVCCAPFHGRAHPTAISIGNKRRGPFIMEEIMFRKISDSGVGNYYE